MHSFSDICGNTVIFGIALVVLKIKTSFKTTNFSVNKFANDRAENTFKMVKITNHRQMKRLVELMEANEHLAKNFRRGVGTSQQTKLEWESLAEELNSIGPPLRNGKEWQKVWFDAKFKVKQKLIFNKKEIVATGGGSFKQKCLNDVEEAIARLLSLHDVISPTGNVAGPSPSTVTPIKIPSTSDDIISDAITEILTETSTPTTASQSFALPLPRIEREEDLREDVRQKSSKKINKNVFQTLLEKQTMVQEELFTDIKESLNTIKIQMIENNNNFKEIKECINNVSDHLKESSRYHRKLFYLKEKQLEMIKVEMERNEKQRLQENKLKLMDMEIRKRQLDIEERKINILETNADEV